MRQARPIRERATVGDPQFPTNQPEGPGLRLTSTGWNLIGTPAIRKCSKPPRISCLAFSNRHKGWVRPLLPHHNGVEEARQLSGVQCLTSRSTYDFLNRHPVIRIPSKSLRINADPESNRREKRTSLRSSSAPYENLYPDCVIPSMHETRTTIHQLRLLIGSPVIRILPNPNEISRLKSSNRLKTPITSIRALFPQGNRVTRHCTVDKFRQSIPFEPPLPKHYNSRVENLQKGLIEKC